MQDAEHPEMHVARAFGPVTFWAATIGFVASLAYAAYEILHKIGLPAPKTTSGLIFAFFIIYIVRIYHGILFFAFDSDSNFIVSKLAPRRRILHFSLQTAEMSLCLIAPLLFSYFGLSGGYYLVAAVTALLAVFWAFFFRAMLGDANTSNGVRAQKKYANLITLALDVIGILPVAMHLAAEYRLVGISQAEMAGFGLGFVGFLALYVLLFAIEFAVVYVRPWIEFLRLTRISLGLK